MAAEFSLESVALKMRRVKLEALAKGLHTDYSFLVGPDKATAQLVHCSKVDLLMASEFFEGLIRSGEPCPVHVKHIQPHIFKILIRFISILDLEEMPRLKDVVLLALAADEFLMEPLRDLLCSKIEKRVAVENVWHVLNATCLVPKLAATCTKVLVKETTKCLQHPSFLEASKDSLIFLLQMDSLNIKSELDLLNASLRLAYSRPETEGMELMRAALPHLRLMTLPLDKFSGLAEYLTAEERNYLAGNVFFKNKNVSGPAPLGLNQNTTPRFNSIALVFYELIPESFINEHYLQMICQNLELDCVPRCTKFVCEFTVPRDFNLKGLEILTRVLNAPCLTRREANNMEYHEELGIKVEITNGNTPEVLYHDHIQGKKKFNTWFYYALKKDIVFLKGFKCTINIYPKKGATYLPIANAQVKETHKAAKWSATMMAFNPLDAGCVDREKQKQNFIVKSVTFAPY